MKTIYHATILCVLLPLLTFGQERLRENNCFFKHSVCNTSGAVEGFGTAASKAKLSDTEPSSLKSDLIEKFKLDSITVFGNWKDYYTYDTEGRLIKMQAFSWDSTSNKWINKSTNDYTYNEDNLMSGYAYNSWDPAKKAFLTGWKGEYTYNESGNVTSIIDSKWDSTAKVWMNQWQKDYEYDNNQNLTLNSIMKWDSVGKSWKNEWKEEYTFDANNKQLTYAVSKWNAVPATWEYIWQVDLEYDANGNVLNYLGYQNNSTDGHTWSGWKEIRTYDDSNNIIQYIGSTYDINFKEWALNWKEMYTYDDSNNKIRTDGFSFNKTDSVWGKSQKIDYTIDPSKHSNLLIMPYWIDNVTQSQLKQSVESGYYAAEDTWIEKSRTVYSYSSIMVTNTSATNLTPDYQPTISFKQGAKELVVNSEDKALIQISSISGQIVFRDLIKGESALSLNSLQQGIYIINLTLDSYSISESIIIE